MGRLLAVFSQSRPEISVWWVVPRPGGWWLLSGSRGKVLGRNILAGRENEFSFEVGNEEAVCPFRRGPGRARKGSRAGRGCRAPSITAVRPFSADCAGAASGAQSREVSLLRVRNSGLAASFLRTSVGQPGSLRGRGALCVGRPGGSGALDFRHSRPGTHLAHWLPLAPHPVHLHVQAL